MTDHLRVKPTHLRFSSNFGYGLLSYEKHCMQIFSVLCQVQAEIFTPKIWPKRGTLAILMSNLRTFPLT